MSIAAALGDTLEEQPHNNQPQKSGRFTPYWLMLPGMLWLAIFFVVPLVTLFGTSLMTPVPGGDVGEFEQTFHFANYVNTLTDSTYYVPLFRSFIYAGIATILALAIGYPLVWEASTRFGVLPPVAAAATLSLGTDGTISAARLVFLNAGDTPKVAGLATTQLIGQTPSAELFATAAQAVDGDIEPMASLAADAE